jgi:glucose-6-phosphate isomerase
MRNAELCKDWVLQGSLTDDGSIVRRAFVACSSRSASEKVEAWGIDSEERLFEFWDWVGDL